MLAFLVIVAMALLRRSKSGKSAERPLVNLGATAGILLVLLFSLVDFPLRMLALSAVFAVLFAALLPTRVSGPNVNGRDLAVVEELVRP